MAADSQPGEGFIHPTAIVEAGARIGTGSKVWHHVHVRAGAVIGRNCVLGKNVFVDSGVQIGDGVRVQNNVSVYRGVELRDEVFVGPSVVFTNDRWPRSTSQEWEVSATLVERGATIGANATVVAGNRIGRWSFVGAGSVLTRSISPHEVVAGNPAARLAWICRCAETRVEGDAATLVCDRCGTVLELPTPPLGPYG